MKEGNFLYTFKQPQEKKLKQTNKIRGNVEWCQENSGSIVQSKFRLICLQLQKS